MSIDHDSSARKPARRFGPRGPRTLISLSIASVIGWGCGGGGGGGGDGSSPPPAATGSVSGQVSNNDDGSPVAGAVVSASGSTATATSDGLGNFRLEGVPVGDSVLVRAKAGGYAENLKSVRVVAGQASPSTHRLLPIDASAVADAAAELSVVLPDAPGQVVIPAGSLVRPDGSPATGPVTGTLTQVDPALDVTAMPGGYRAETGLMESWGAIEVNLTDASGQKLNLAPGRQATIRIPLASRSPETPATVPLFFFDESRGLWRQEGAATLGGTAPDLYYEGTVTHFSYWNADRIMETVYVNGCVADAAGARIAGAEVSSDGIDYSGADVVTTDANGNFRVAVRSGSRAVLSAAQVGRISNSIRTDAATADVDRPECLVMGAQGDAVTVKLTWGQAPEDVDSHMFAPDGSQIYFGDEGSLSQAPFVNLDVDDVTSFGPEVVTVNRLMVGTYTYAVNNYRETYSPGMTASPVRVELNQGGSSQVFTPPAGEVAESTHWWTVFTLTVDAQCNMAVQPVGTWSETEPTPAATAQDPVQYCSR